MLGIFLIDDNIFAIVTEFTLKFTHSHHITHVFSSHNNVGIEIVEYLEQQHNPHRMGVL